MEQDVSFRAAEVQRTQILIDDLPGNADQIISMQPNSSDFWHTQSPTLDDRLFNEAPMMDKTHHFKIAVCKLVITLTNMAAKLYPYLVNMSTNLEAWLEPSYGRRLCHFVTDHPISKREEVEFWG